VMVKGRGTRGMYYSRVIHHGAILFAKVEGGHEAPAS
jgi:hypothetical protein